MRIELQMALDSRDSDIEQLRNYLQSLSVPSLDAASVSSGPEFDADDAYTGWESSSTPHTLLDKEKNLPSRAGSSLVIWLLLRAVGSTGIFLMIYC